METILKEKDGYSLIKIENVRYGKKTLRYEIRSIGGYVQGMSKHNEKQAINQFEKQYDREKFLSKR